MFFKDVGVRGREIKGGEAIEFDQKVLSHPFLHVRNPGYEDNVPMSEWDLEEVNGVEKGFIGGEVSP